MPGRRFPLLPRQREGLASGAILVYPQVSLSAKRRKNVPVPVQISFRHMDPSPALEARVHEKAEKLERFFDRIVSCEVVVEAPHKHHHKGKLYNVRIEINVPGASVNVGRSGPQDHAHEDVYVALRDAFDAAYRQLEDHARRMRGDVKTHTR